MSVQRDWSRVRRWEYTTAELIEIAGEAGYKISAVQLAQWHRYGLLPRPRKQSLGQGNGSVSLYPAAARDCLEDLLPIHAAEGGRRLLCVAWRLWWIGRPVAMKRVRELLAREADRFDRDRSLLAAQSAEEREAMVQHMYRKELSPAAKPFSRLRQRVRGDTPQLLHLIAEAITGSVEPSDEDLRLARKASGLARVNTSKGRPSFGGVPPLDPASQATLTAWLESFSRPLRPLLDSLSDEELVAARDEARAFFANLQGYVSATATLRIKGDVVVTDWTPVEDLFAQAAFVLLWRSVRASAQAQPEGTIDPAQASAAASELADFYEIVRALRRSETFADLLSPERLSLAGADKRSLERFQVELQARIDEHRDEARALVEEAKVDRQ